MSIYVVGKNFPLLFHTDQGPEQCMHNPPCTISPAVLGIVAVVVKVTNSNIEWPSPQTHHITYPFINYWTHFE